MIKIICFGKIKENYLEKAIEDYKNRISKYHKIEIIELKDDPSIDREEALMLKYIDNKNLNIALDICGKLVDSVELSKTIDNNLGFYNNICFFVGSSNGLSQNIKNKCTSISFGKITMPHGVFRLVLTEQIYRAFKIINNETYHK